MRGSFTLELTKMLVEEIVGDGDHPVEPRAPRPALIAADQQDRGAAGVEGKETRMSLAGGISSFMFWCLDCLIVSTSGRPRLGPPRWRTFTAAVAIRIQTRRLLGQVLGTSPPASVPPPLPCRATYSPRARRRGWVAGRPAPDSRRLPPSPPDARRRRVTTLRSRLVRRPACGRVVRSRRGSVGLARAISASDRAAPS